MEAKTTPTKIPFDVELLRKDFPILSREVNGQPLAYLDNGATAQKPKSVLAAITGYYNNQNSNVHRGVHALSQEATDVFEQARDDARAYFNAERREEMIFTNGTTDSINLLATSFGRQYIGPGDEVILSEMEHHSNIVPWQMLCQEKGATVKYIPVTDNGELDMDAYRKLRSPKTKLVAVTHVSNVLGTINPVKEIIDLAHEMDIPVLLDGAQAVPHMKVDLRALDCDFYVFSAHKMFGPTGMGMLYGKTKWLEKIPPYQGGGEMIKEVTLEGATYNELPYKFEAGTPNISAGVAFSATFRYLNALDLEGATRHEHAVFQHAMEGLSTIEGIRFIGTAKNKVPLIAFVVEGVHHYDIGMLLDKMGIAVRTGHSCAQPLMQRFNITGTVRASLAFYNTMEEADRLVAGVKKAVQMLRP